jgi:NADH:ubiquinone reductase (non-electrogenic)
VTSLSLFVCFLSRLFPGHLPGFVMATRSLARARVAAPSTLLRTSLPPRTFTSQSQSYGRLFRVTLPLRASQSRHSIHRTARRSYAATAPAPVPAPAPKKRFRFLRWTYRLTLLTGLGLAGTICYNIYTLTHPVEQIEPDPDKKTLVILGTWS